MKTKVAELKSGVKFKFSPTSSWSYIVDKIDTPLGSRSKSGMKLNAFVLHTTDGDEFLMSENEVVYLVKGPI